MPTKSTLTQQTSWQFTLKRGVWEVELRPPKKHILLLVQMGLLHLGAINCEGELVSPARQSATSPHDFLKDD